MHRLVSKIISFIYIGILPNFTKHTSRSTMKSVYKVILMRKTLRKSMWFVAFDSLNVVLNQTDRQTDR